MLVNDFEAARALFYALAGAFIALSYFCALAWNVRSYVRGGARWAAALVHVLRLLGFAAGFALVARGGPLPLFSALVGFHLLRIAILRRQQRMPEIAS